VRRSWQRWSRDSALVKATNAGASVSLCWKVGREGVRRNAPNSTAETYFQQGTPWAHNFRIPNRRELRFSFAKRQLRPLIASIRLTKAFRTRCNVCTVMAGSALLEHQIFSRVRGICMLTNSVSETHAVITDEGIRPTQHSKEMVNHRISRHFKRIMASKIGKFLLGTKSMLVNSGKLK
jgi:hypothetical protein